MPVIHNSLLESVDVAGVSKLLANQKLFDAYQRDIEFIYVVDHSEVSQYCFPFGLDIYQQPKTSIDIIADKQMARYHLFEHNTEKRPIVFFNEYRDEYVNLAQKLANNVNTLTSQDFEKLLGALDDLPGSDQDQTALIEFVYNHLSVLLFYFSGLFTTGAEKFARLKRHFMFTAAQLRERYPEEVVNAFVENQPGPLARELFTELRRRNEFDTKRPNELIRLHKQILNLITDCEVLDRIIHINQQLTTDFFEQRTDKWYIVLFISSSNSLRQAGQVTSYIHSLPAHSPDILFDPFNHLSEWYFYLISHDQTRLKEFDTFKQLLEEEEESKRTKRAIEDKEDFKMLRQTLERRISDRRQLYENRGLLDEFDSLNLDVSITTGKDTTILLQQKREIFEKAIGLFKIIDRDKLPNVPDDQQLAAMIEFKNEGTFRLHFFQGLQEIQEKLIAGQRVFQISRGKDYIEGTNQHLPIAFKLKGDVQEVVATIVGLYLDPVLSGQKAEELVNYFANKWPKKLSEARNTESATSLLDKIYPLTPRFDELLVQFLIYLILPRPDRSESYEEQAYRDLTVILRDIERFCLTSPHNETLLEYRLEYLYVACWMARRIGKYDEAIVHTAYGKTLDSLDPRFLHSECLIEYSKAMQQEDELGTTADEAKMHFNAALAAAQACIGLLTNRTAQLFSKTITSKIVSTLYNTCCYVYARLSRYEKGEPERQLLGEARTHWGLLASREPRFREFPEYIHSEAYLLYREGQTDVADKRTKLEQALSSARKSIDLKREQTPVDIDRTIYFGLHTAIKKALEEPVINR